MKVLLENQDKLADLAKDLLESAKKEKVNLICFFAELGAGKTTFSKYIAKELGVKENIISPTFVILKEYKTADSTFKKLVHIDAYRLKNESDAKIFKLSDYLQEGNLILLEWAENFENLPTPRIDIKIQVPNKQTRVFNILNLRGSTS